MLRML